MKFLFFVVIVALIGCEGEGVTEFMDKSSTSSDASADRNLVDNEVVVGSEGTDGESAPDGKETPETEVMTGSEGELEEREGEEVQTTDDQLTCEELRGSGGGWGGNANPKANCTNYGDAQYVFCKKEDGFLEECEGYGDQMEFAMLSEEIKTEHVASQGALNKNNHGQCLNIARNINGADVGIEVACLRIQK